MIDRFKSEDGAWFDDVLIGQMIGLAKETGDVTRNPVSSSRWNLRRIISGPRILAGMYVFRGVEHPAVIAVERSRCLGRFASQVCV